MMSSNNRHFRLERLFVFFLLIHWQTLLCYGILKEYNFTITYEPVKECGDPDRAVIHVNGLYPPPEIRVKVGDTIRVNMINNMPVDNITLHFHGIRQHGTPKADGVPFITQYPIGKNDGLYTYEFPACLDQVGTYFYHSHVGLTSITGHGPLIIEEEHPPFDYDADRVVVLSDFWNKTNTDDSLEAGLYAGPFQWILSPADLLINGRTKENSACGPYIFNVEPNKIYRFRIIGATTLEDLIFAIGGHTMTIIEADGTYVNPIQTDVLEVAPGQRYSVLVKTDQQPNDYDITANVIIRPDRPERSAIAILHYEGANRHVNISVPQMTAPLEHPLTVLDNYNQYLPPFPKSSSRQIILRGQQVVTTNGGRQWVVNAIGYKTPETPILLDLYSGNRPIYTNYTLLLPSGYNVSTGTYPLRYGETIDLVFQNTIGAEGSCEYHPWHTHGHAFWEIASGAGEFSGSNFASPSGSLPVIRDTTLVYPKPATGLPMTGCGWKLVRFVANNPGIWIAHCHITPHMLMGMSVAFEEATDHLNETSSSDYCAYLKV